MDYSEGIKRLGQRAGQFISKHRYHCAASVLIFFWILPYFTSGTKVEWGDFGFFAQAYEAMRVSILHYHQFPWYNPWMSGGVPLYANPQIGLFSPQMIFVLIFGTVRGLKYALAMYTVLGYVAMYFFLTRYFKLDKLVSTLLSLIWIFCTFFVAHLPAHFTYTWFMLSPFFFYLALTVKGWKGGLYLGGAFAIMALSQIHDPFFMIMPVCAVIIVARLALDKKSRLLLLKCVGAASLVFTVVAGHRLLYTFQNVHDFPMNVSDPTTHLITAVLGPLLPMSYIHPWRFISYPVAPQAPYGFGEVTATIGLFALLAVFTSASFFVYRLYLERRAGVYRMRKELIILGAIAIFWLVALGRFNTFAPYNFLKHLPIYKQMRVSTRWFIFFDAGMLVFVGLMIRRMQKRSFPHVFVIALLTFGVAELFFYNVGYQGHILSNPVVVPPKGSWNYQFAQTSYFGQTRKLPGGGEIPNDGHMPHAYREFEATMWNLGILYANDSLVQLPLDPRHVPGGHPTCPWEEGCHYVLSQNASVSYWSPDKIVLTRTKPGPIKMNMNNSNYFIIDGVRQNTSMVVMPFTDFTINAPNSQKTITIVADPSLVTPIKDIFHKHQSITLLGQPK